MKTLFNFILLFVFLLLQGCQTVPLKETVVVTKLEMPVPPTLYTQPVVCDVKEPSRQAYADADNAGRIVILRAYIIDMQKCIGGVLPTFRGFQQWYDTTSKRLKDGHQ